MAPTEGRVAMPERWWDCHSGTSIAPVITATILQASQDFTKKYE